MTYRLLPQEKLQKITNLRFENGSQEIADFISATPCRNHCHPTPTSCLPRAYFSLLVTSCKSIGILKRFESLIYEKFLKT